MEDLYIPPPIDTAYQLKNLEKVFFASPEEQAEALQELRSRLSSSKELACKPGQISDATLKRALWAKRNNVKSALSVVLGYCSWYKKLLPADQLATTEGLLGEHPRLRLKIEDVENVLATGLLVHPLQVRDTAENLNGLTYARIRFATRMDFP